MQIRRAIEADIPKLLPLMRELAEFEGYAQEFAITEDVLREQGYRRSPPGFSCIVAEEGNNLVGLLVYYFVPYTYRAKPDIVVKELYVAREFRSQGIGELLMRAVAREAARTGCGKIKWWVAKWNDRSIKFYQRLGATIDPNWHEFQMSEATFQALAVSNQQSNRVRTS